MDASGLVIVGAGQAGFQAAVSARAFGYDGAITLVGAEPQPPYQRPPLSKAYLLGKLDEPGLALQRPDFYQAKRIRLLTGTTVDAIDRGRRQVVLSDGASLPYEYLVLATGARSRRLGIEGEGLKGVHYLRDLADAQALRRRIEQVENVVVVGGGFIGLEFAAVARERGLQVTVLEAGARLMGRIVSPVLSGYFLDLHARHGVDVRLEAKVEQIEGEDAHVEGVRLRDCGRVPAQMVVIGAGAVPNSELAQSCGLSAPGAVQVDDFLRTADSRVFAIGDCAAYPHRGRHQRLESVQNAVDQGKHVARVIGGDMAPYGAVPWFWSDQFGTRLQIAGLVQDADERIVRGDMNTGRFSVFSFLGGELQGVESVNCPADHVLARRLLAHPHAVTAQEAGDEGVDIKALANERINGQGVPTA
ncbi:MAG: FAD-dependent oxidoreductase [Pusillimonas sp.]